MTRTEGSVVVVPARRDSTRLPRKLLLAESGRPLLAYTLERCRASRMAERVVAAVDGGELAEVARAAGAEAILTPPELRSGSDRAWAAVAALPAARWIVNVQGDEPLVEPAAIDALFAALGSGAEVVTLCTPFPAGRAPEDPSAVKVVADGSGRALYFSRALVPYPRNAGAAAPRLHLGLYGYSRAALQRFASLPQGPLERAEGLEQLRFLEHGDTIQVLEWPRAFQGVDTREDYEAFLERVGQRA